MIYIVDKNTNRLIYVVQPDGKYLLDDHTFKVEARWFDLKNEKLWHWKYDKNTGTFRLAPK